jgi:quercetin dioxygenase-like cupin family protein
LSRSSPDPSQEAWGSIASHALCWSSITVIAASFLVSAPPFEYFGESDNHFRELFYLPLFQIIYTIDSRSVGVPTKRCGKSDPDKRDAINDSKGRNENMDIKRSGSQPSGKGPAEYFTGTVRLDPLFEAPDPARAACASVTFEPGARTAWHTHPLGQTLIVTAGYGRAQRWGGPIEEIRPGDVVWFPPGEKHWHGAAPTTAMTHIAIQERLDGKAVDWMEHVSDEQYQG